MILHTQCSKPLSNQTLPYLIAVSLELFQITEKDPPPPPRSLVVRASAGGAGEWGSIPNRVTLKQVKLGDLRFSVWFLALMS